MYKLPSRPETRRLLSRKKGIESEASALILFIIEDTEDSLRSKIQLFLSFQISQLTRSVIERTFARGVRYRSDG
jgi:hypothetical protein